MRISTAILLALFVAVVPVRAQDDPAATLDFANGLFLRGLYQEAAQEYRNYLDAAGSDASTQAWYRLGEAAFAGGDYDAARSALEGYRQRAPQGEHAERAALRLAESFQRLDRPRDAIPLFEQLGADAAEDSVRAAALYGLGRAMSEDNNPQGAMRPFLRLIQDYPNDPRVPFGRFQLARVYLELDQADEAARLFDAVATDTAAADEALRHEARFRAAESFARSGEHGRAITSYEALAREAPGGAYAERAAYGIAWTAHAAGDYERAGHAASAFVEAHPGSEFAPAARYLRGHALQELGDLAAASAAYEALILAEPDSPFAQRATIRLAWVRYLDGDAAGAREASRRLLAAGNLTDADAGDAHYLVALIDTDSGDLEAALAGFDRVVTEYFESTFATDAAYKRAETLARLGRTAEAAIAFEAFATENPAHGLAREALLRGGDAAFFDADFSEAIAQYQRVLDAEPEPEVEELTRYRLALSHHNARQFEQSAEAFRALLERFPDSEHAAEGHLRIGEYHLEEGNAGPALNAFVTALDAATDDALTGRALRGAGLAHYQLGNHDEAAQRLARLIADFPGVALDPDAALWLGQYAFDNERYSLAASAFEHILSSSAAVANRGAIQFKLAESLELDGQVDAALAAFARVEAIEPNSAWSLDAGYRQGLLLETKGDAEAARAKFEAAARVLEGSAPARARLRLAAMDLEAENFAESARGYMMVAVLYEDPALTPEALMGAAKAYAANGEPAKARACYEELLRDFPDSSFANEARERMAELTP